MSYTVRPSKTKTQSKTSQSALTSAEASASKVAAKRTTPASEEIGSKVDSETDSEEEGEEQESVGKQRKKAKNSHTDLSSVESSIMPSRFQWQPSLGKEAGKFSCLHATYGSPWPSASSSALDSNLDSVTVAAFDVDGTLISPRLGPDGKQRTWPHPIDHTDFRELSFFNISMFSRVRAEYESGKVVVLFTNQNLRPEALETWRRKIPLVSQELNVPHHIFVAIRGHPNAYRKPGIEMWNSFSRIWRERGGARIEMKGERRSWFCGDAAGREADPENGRELRDHSDADKGFAENAGLKFFTPEEYCSQFVPTSRQERKPSLNVPIPLFKSTSTPLVNYSPIREIVLFVGPSGCGKTTFYERYFKPACYSWVNQDTLKTKEKCETAVNSELLKFGKVVVDNTNTSLERRKAFIAIAQAHKIPIRCIQFDTDLKVCIQNSLYRSHQNPSRTPTPSARVEEMYEAISSDPPSLFEGFQEIKHVNWIWQGSEKEKEVWDSFAGRS